MLFEVFYVGFGQFIAALAPNENFASLLVPAFFTFVVSFCGALVPYASLPQFWQSWMYWLTPFRYLLESFLGVLTHDVPVKCLPREMARFSPPNGMTCREYAEGYAKQSGGYVEDMVDGLCSFCQYSTGDHFVGFLLSYRSLVDKTRTNGYRLQRLISSTHRNGATMYVIPLRTHVNQSIRS